MYPLLLTGSEVVPLSNLKIQKIWQDSYEDYCQSGHFQSDEQRKASRAILACKSSRLGINVSECRECGYMEFHNNSCRNRNCPNCQAVLKEIWVDKRRAEVIDSPYFHVVFTLPHELSPLIYCNQKLLYGLLHKCCAETLLELSADKKYLGAQPGIIQVLHTWNQELDYHVHMHCIVSGGGLTPDRRIRKSSAKFFIPVRVLRDKFQGKYLALLEALHQQEKLVFSSSCRELQENSIWQEFKNSLYGKDWCPYIKETFNGFGNAIEYLGRYTHQVAISNSRILSVTETKVVFSARGRKPGDPKRQITLSHEEFIRRFLLHVLPAGFQKIRYYGFLNNRMKSRNLKLIFRLQGCQRFRQRYAGFSMAELLKAVWNIDLAGCPECCRASMQQLGRSHAPFP
ncbi:MAG: IS91 family transposase [Coprococcus phoceensis]|nr:IS91 family transposase [Clostridiales bacterium]